MSQYLRAEQAYKISLENKFNHKLISKIGIKYLNKIFNKIYKASKKGETDVIVVFSGWHLLFLTVSNQDAIRQAVMKTLKECGYYVHYSNTLSQFFIQWKQKND